jgi:hypothetical protein
MYYTAASGRRVEKVKVTRINNMFVLPFTTTSPREKIIKDYVYSPEARIIA